MTSRSTHGWTHARMLWALAAVMIALQVGSAGAQSLVNEAAFEAEQRIYSYFDQQRYRTALQEIDAYLQRWPNRPNMLYNKACAHALIGERDAAAAALRQAVEAGFSAFEHMRGDSDLDSIRDHPTYIAIVNAVQQAARQDAMRLITRWRNRFGDDGYAYEVDETHHICYATALDETAHSEMRAMLERQADHLASVYFGSMPDYYAMVAVPTPAHVDELLKGKANVGGVYDHGQKVLVARNIGGSLRHEFFHLMHYGHMERLGQEHPLWIQEGMASLYEDYRLDDDGAIEYLPNERHNVTRTLVRRGAALPWDRLLSITDDQFMASATKLYPQARSIFEYIAARGKLQPWYETYTAMYAEDRTGRQAIEAVFDEPLEDVERRWRRWVLSRPAVDMYIRDGDAALGIVAEMHGSNDGVQIAEIVRGSSADGSGLQVGDVIVAVDGTPTRSLKELQALIGGRLPGDAVEVRARRDGAYLTRQVVLQALRPQRALQR